MSFRIKTVTRISQALTATVSFLLVFFGYRNSQPTDLFLAIFFLYASTVIVDKVGDIFSSYSLENDERDLRNRLDRLPSLFAGRNDIVSFSNHIEGIKYCLCVCPQAISVKNTVLRQGNTMTQMPIGGDDIYKQWISAKKESLKNASSWTEIVSQHFEAEDAQKKFMQDAKDQKYYYQYFSVDDNPGALGHTMIQMTIFEFANGVKEILFGWDFPKMRHGPCFLTRNTAIIDYFENYFRVVSESSPSEKAST